MWRPEDIRAIHANRGGRYDELWPLHNELVERTLSWRQSDLAVKNHEWKMECAGILPYPYKPEGGRAWNSQERQLVDEHFRLRQQREDLRLRIAPTLMIIAIRSTKCDPDAIPVCIDCKDYTGIDPVREWVTHDHRLCSRSDCQHKYNQIPF